MSRSGSKAGAGSRLTRPNPCAAIEASPLRLVCGSSRTLTCTCSAVIRTRSRNLARPPGFTVSPALAILRRLFPSLRNRTSGGAFGCHSHRWRHVGAHGHGNPKMKRLLVCAAMLGGLALASQAQAGDHAAGVKIGTLSCHEASGWGFVFGSSHDVRCTFSNGDRIEHYRGSISKFGVDIGYQRSGVLLWEVIAPSDHPMHGALEGHYGGLTA